MPTTTLNASGVDFTLVFPSSPQLWTHVAQSSTVDVGQMGAYQFVLVNFSSTWLQFFVIAPNALGAYDTSLTVAQNGTVLITGSVGDLSDPAQVWDTAFFGQSLSADAFLGADLFGFSESISGGAGSDHVLAFAGNDTIDGGAGNDTLEGGLGNDTYVVGTSAAGVSIVEALGAGTDLVQSALSYTLGGNVENLTLTGTGNLNGTGNDLGNWVVGTSGNNLLAGAGGADTLDGNAGSDTLEGGDGADTLIGDGGDDSMAGGDGDDWYDVGSALDVVSESAGQGADGVVATITYTLGAEIEHLVLGGSSAISGTGNGGNNSIAGNAANNTLAGLAGDDTLEGGAGSDSLAGGAGNDRLAKANGGTDTLAGGAGDDTYFLDPGGSGFVIIVEIDGEGTDLLETYFSWTLEANVENLTLLGSAASGTGNVLANVITGNGASNSLSGGSGADTLLGGLGNDTYSVNSTDDVASESGGGGTDLVLSSVTYTLAEDIENLTLSGASGIAGTGNGAANYITGNSAGNSLVGNAGNDTLDGGLGNDTMAGGTGNDVYGVNASTDSISESAAEGIDEVESTVSYTLPANVEDLELFSSGSSSGTGNSENNRIVGNSQNNTLAGLAGNDSLVAGSGNDSLLGGAGADTLEGGGFLEADTLAGGADDDLYVYDPLGGGATVVEAADEGTDEVRTPFNHTLAANVENLMLTGSNSVSGTGNGSANVIAGNIGNNSLAGGAGNDTLDGGDGADTLGGGAGTDSLSGGAGNDLYVVDGDGDALSEAGGGGTDTVSASVSYTLSGSGIENLRLSGGADLSGAGDGGSNLLEGNSGHNSLEGGAGADTLDGGAGNDTLAGGADNDVYVVGSAADVILEAGGGGTDLVLVIASGYTLGAEVENLQVSSALSGVAAAGNELDNSLLGDAQADTLEGGAGADTLDGGAGSDSLLGGTGEDLLVKAGSGADTLAAGAGNDTYLLDSSASGSATIVEADAEGSDLVQSYFSWTLESHVESLLLLGSAALSGTGNALANALTGNSGANTLDGAGGADTLSGGGGNDLYVVDEAADQVIESAGGGAADRVSASVSYTLGSELENLTLTGNADLSGSGNSGDNSIVGNDGANTLAGGGGDDTLAGGLGNDVYYFDAAGTSISDTGGVDLVITSSFSLILGADIENLTLEGSADLSGTGSSGSNVITGNSGHNSLDGGSGGADTLFGGLGNDTYSVNSTDDVASEAGGGGIDLVLSTATHTLQADLENLTLGGTALVGVGNASDNSITGNASNNTLEGGAGADTLDGGAGSDSLAGGAGNDSYIVAATGDSISEANGDGIDTVFSSAASFTLAAGFENLVLTSGTSGAGNASENVITGNALANTLDGAGGSDTLAGDAGNDTYVVDASGDVVDESGGGGVDLVRSSVDYSLGAGIENLTLTGSADIAGSGNTAANLINGNTGNNSLDGGDGNDSLAGDAGNDTLRKGAGSDTLAGGDGNDVYVLAAGDTGLALITELSGQGLDRVESAFTWTLEANVEDLTLLGGEAIAGFGNSSGNVISGNGGANTLDGAAGNDTLHGGDGDDLLIQSHGTADAFLGGAGNDTYRIVVGGAAPAITEDPGAGDADLVESAVSLTLAANVENLTLTGAVGLAGTGNASANVITGNSGSNFLDGGGGVDTLIGGAGNDSFGVDDPADQAVEIAGGGLADRVIASISYTLPSGSAIEDLELSGSADLSAKGNELGNFIFGNSGANTLEGGGGNDWYEGGAGNDTYIIGSQNDTLIDSAGVDTVVSPYSQALNSGFENLVLAGTADLWGRGNLADNVITGNGGANTLNGLQGADTLYGGLGSDTYAVDDAGDIASEEGGGGSDLVLSIAAAHTLAADIETLVLDGSSNIAGAGNASDNLLVGNAGANTLSGAGGSDTLDGGAGNDSLAGGAGDDRYLVDSAGDLAADVADGGFDIVDATASFSLGADIEVLNLLGAAASGTGNALANTISGNGLANTLDGGAGSDTLLGGAGNDVYRVDTAADLASEAGGSGAADLVLSSAPSYTLEAGLENLTLDTGGVAGKGNAQANILLGNAGANTLEGAGGDDSMDGGAGDDTYVVEDGADSISDASGRDLVRSSASYSLGSGLEELLLTGSANLAGSGNAAANVVTGNSGDNSLDGGAHNDTLIGGLGNDTFRVDSSLDVATESAGQGADLVISTATFSLGAEIENLTLEGDAAINGTGNASDNVIAGNPGHNSLSGNGGADTLLGGLGNDSYAIDSADDVASEAGGGGTDHVTSSVDYSLLADVEHLTLAGSALIGTGNAGANSITGTAGADTLDGGAGNDSLSGGAGNDVYFVDALDQLEDSGGTELVFSSVSFSLASGFEHLTLQGAASLTGTGNALDNSIAGNAGANTLDGQAGADTMAGGEGDDTYVVDVPEDSVSDASGADLVRSTAHYTLGAGIEDLVLLGSGHLRGTGNASANRLSGNDGANTLDGGVGADTLVGGAGNDLYFLDDSGDLASEAGGSGIDEVRTSASHTLDAGLENLTLEGTDAISATGNALANVLTGNSGANTLDGGAGADTMAGGAGDDTYIVEHAADSISDSSGADLVRAGASYTLGPGLEALELTGGSDLAGAGNALDNVLTGNAGANTLAGGAGSDTLIGGGGNDRYTVESAGDLVVESEGGGTDTVASAAAAYTLGANVEDGIVAAPAGALLRGNEGDNRLAGGSGSDTLDGAGGSDFASYANASAGVVASLATGAVAGQGNDSLVGIEGVEGSAHADTLASGAGSDTLQGGPGNDLYFVNGALDRVVEAASADVDVVRSSAASFSLGAHIEVLELEAAAGHALGIGNNQANRIVGNAGNNTLDGGGGADTLAGGAGNDTYLVDSVEDRIEEGANGGTDTVLVDGALPPQAMSFGPAGAMASIAAGGQITYTLGANVENLDVQGVVSVNATANAANNFLVGGMLADRLVGLEGNDTLDGGQGADTLAGGAGNDLYHVRNGGDQVVEAGSGGTDTVRSSLPVYSLAANAEILLLAQNPLGPAVILEGIGNNLDNRIEGNTSDNRLFGGLGADTLIGGGGNDRLYGGLGSDSYFVDGGDSVIEVSGSAADQAIAAAFLDLRKSTGIENARALEGVYGVDITGNKQGNRISGNENANRLDGGRGGSGDTLEGGLGDDTYVLNSGLDRIIDTGGTGDAVETDADGSLVPFATVENLVLTGSANLKGTGNALGNLLRGNAGDNQLSGLEGGDELEGGAGADTLDGGAGNDRLYGGAGNDTYVVDAAGDQVFESARPELVSVTAAGALGDGDSRTGPAPATVISGDGRYVQFRSQATNFPNDPDALFDVFRKDMQTGELALVSRSVGAEVAFSSVSLAGRFLTFSSGSQVYLRDMSADPNAPHTLLSASSAGQAGDAASRMSDLTADARFIAITSQATNLVGDDANGLQDVFLRDRVTATTTRVSLADDESEANGASGDGVAISANGQVVVFSSAATNLGAGESLEQNGVDDIYARNLVLGTTVLVSAGAGEGVEADGASRNARITPDGRYVVFESDATNLVEGDANAATDVFVRDLAEGTTRRVSLDAQGGEADGASRIGGISADGRFVLFQSTAANLVAGDDNGASDVFVKDLQSGAIARLSPGAAFEADISEDGRYVAFYTSSPLAGDTLGHLDVVRVANPLFFGGGGGIDTVRAAITYSLAGDLENLVLGGTAAIHGTGNAGANLIAGNSGANSLTGGAGADTLDGGTGADTLDGGDDGDVYIVDVAADKVLETGAGGVDEIWSAVSLDIGVVALSAIENVTLIGTAASAASGNAAANQITGNAGANTLDGRAGADTLAGGAGNDLYNVDALDSITEAAGAGIDTVRVNGSWSLGANFEHLVLLGTTEAHSGTGNELANSLAGNGGANTLDGGAGADTMGGGAGGDRYVVDVAGDVVNDTGTGAQGTDTVVSAVSYSLGATLENLVLAGTSLRGAGNSLANTLAGGAGADTLDGGAQNDRLEGGAGNDLYILDSQFDVVVEADGADIDEVRSAATFLGHDNFVERIVLTGAAAANATGNTADNLITGNTGANSLVGNAGADTLDGGAGADTLEGGAGNDIYVADATADRIIESGVDALDVVLAAASWTLGGALENLTLIGAAATAGVGNELANVITGNAAANSLTGLAGADTLAGGAGNDLYTIDASDSVIEAAGAGIDTVRIGASWSLADNLEHLVLLGNTEGYAATGNALANSLTGNAGANTLDGAAGADTMAGGAGGDHYYVDAAGDVVNDTGTGTQGTDVVFAAVHYTLGAALESLVLTGTDLRGTGNALGNTITGGAGADTLDGLAGADSLAGGAGDDRYSIDGASEVFEAEDLGADTVVTALNGYTLGANLENLVLTGAAASGFGNALDNFIAGTAGANSLAGGGGHDVADYFFATTGVTVNLQTQRATGGGGVDTLDGFEGARGGAGADTMIGDGQDNSFYVGAGDLVTGNGGTDTVFSTISYSLGADLENLELLGIADLSATGNGFHNVITGNAGNNTVAGGLGNDTLSGADGVDVVDYSAAPSAVSVDLMSGVASGALGADSVSGFEGVRGSAHNDSLSGGGGNADIVDYSLAAAAVTVNLDTGQASGGAGNDTLLGFEWVIGSAGNDTLTGASAGSTIDGGAGADSMVGNAGNDTFLVSTAGDSVLGGGGNDRVISQVSYSLLANDVEHLLLTGASGLSGAGNSLANAISGNTGANSLTGNGGADTLDGGTGADTLAGGGGNDFYLVDVAADKVVEAADEGVDTVRAALAYTLGAHLENLVLTGTAAIAGTGNELANAIAGNAGANTLNGAAGADTLSGGAGNDLYLVDHADDRVSEEGGGGIDLVQAGASFSLAAGVENLVLTGTGNFDGTGNELANWITGNAGHNLLDGGAGADTLDGGAGNDTYVIDLPGDVLSDASGVDTIRSPFGLTLAAAFENLVLTGEGDFAAAGNAAANSLAGGAGNDTLSGVDGSDTLAGNAGADSLSGGAGNDLYVADEDDSLLETAAGGLDTVRIAVNWTLGENFENLTYGGSGDWVGTGNAAANQIRGGSGADTLDGGGGADTLVGGLGNDVFMFDSTADTVSDAGGIDTLYTPFATTLAAALESLVLTGTATAAGVGNLGDNLIAGNAGANALSGLAGADTLAGNGGADTLDGGAGADSLAGGEGNDRFVFDAAADQALELAGGGIDTVVSSVNAALGEHLDNLLLAGGALQGTGNELPNLIVGTAAANILSGGDGADTLDGGGGNDALFGEAGDDVFVWDAADGALAGGAGTDSLRLAGAGITLDLATIPDSRYSGFERIDIGGTGANTLRFAAQDVRALGGEGAMLRIDGDLFDVVDSQGRGWALQGVTTVGDAYYIEYRLDELTLLVHQDLTQLLS